MDTELTKQQRRRVYSRLMAGFDAMGLSGEVEERWNWLMAAHVVGQGDLRLHLDSLHRMLRLAMATRDWGEAAGQVFRLALVPLGHALRRLPAGNIGRATVSAFRPMRPDEKVQRLIASALG